MKKFFVIFLICFIFIPQIIVSEGNDKNYDEEKEKIKRWNEHIESQIKWLDENINNKDILKEEKEIYKKMKKKFLLIVKNLTDIRELYKADNKKEAKKLEEENRRLEFEIDILRIEIDKIHLINKLSSKTKNIDSSKVNNYINNIKKCFDKIIDNNKKINELKMENDNLHKEIMINEKKIEIEILEAETEY